MNSTPNCTVLGDYNVSTTPAPTDGAAGILGIVQYIILVVTMILLLTLNPLCLLVLRRVDSIQDTTKVFLVALTVADLGVGIFLALPITFAAFYNSWPFGAALCGLQAFLIIPLMFYFCPLSLLMLTVDRYISVVHALRYPSLVTVKRARVVVMSGFAAFFLISIGSCFAAEWDLKYQPTLYVCAFINPNQHRWTLTFTQVLYSCTVISCLLVVLTTYIKLFLISRHHNRRIHADNPVALEGNPPPGPNNKMLHTLLLIVLSAFILNLLPLSWFILGDIIEDSFVTFSLFALPILTNSWLNVVIYFFRNKDMRQATRNLLRTYLTFLQQRFTCNLN